ncbi:hypothetical protein CHUAL_006416 [Chamberlinius hualienensis]
MSFSKSFTISRHSALLSFGDRIIYFVVESDKDKVSCYCSLYKLDHNTNKIIVDKQFDKISLAHGFRRECELSIQTCQHFQLPDSGLDFPFVVLKRRHRVDRQWKSELLYIGLLLNKTVLNLSIYGDTVKLPDSEADMNVHEPLCLNGPCVAYTGKHNIYLEYLSSRSRKNITWKLSPNDHPLTPSSQLQTQMSVPKVIAAINSFQLNRNDSQLGQQSVKCVFLLLTNHGTAKFIKAAANLNETEMSVTESFEFKQSLFFTRYLKMATVVKMESESSSLDRLTILVCTRQSQLIRFDNWKQPTASKMLTIPFSDTNEIEIFIKSKQKHGIARSQTGAAVVVNLETFQVVKSNPEKLDYLLGYFAPVPNIQLLQISAENPEKPISDRHFEVTDFKDVIKASELFTDETTDIKTAAAVDKVLHNKMTTVERNVSSAQSRLQDLTKTVEEVSSVLRCLTLNQDVEINVGTRLLGLVTGNVVEPSEPEPFNVNSRSLLCSEPWQKIVDNHWVIGVDITNDLDTCAWNFALGVSINSKDVNYRGKFFSSSKRFPESPILQSSKKRRSESTGVTSDNKGSNSENSLQPGEMGIVTAVFDVGIIAHNVSIVVNVSVKYNKASPSGSPITTCVNCSSCTLNMDNLMACVDISKSEDNIIRNLAVMDAVTQPLNVTLSSKTTDLINIFATLTALTPFRQHLYTQVLYWPREEQMNRLHGVWIELLDIDGSTAANLCFHSKDNNQTFLLVHYLYSKLPEDVLILPFKENKPPNLIECLSREVNVFQSFTKKALADPKILETSLKNYHNFRNELTAAENESDKAFVCLLNGHITG